MKAARSRWIESSRIDGLQELLDQQKEWLGRLSRGFREVRKVLVVGNGQEPLDRQRLEGSWSRSRSRWIDKKILARQVCVVVRLDK